MADTFFSGLLSGFQQADARKRQMHMDAAQSAISEQNAKMEQERIGLERNAQQQNAQQFSVAQALKGREFDAVEKDKADDRTRKADAAKQRGEIQLQIATMRNLSQEQRDALRLAADRADTPEQIKALADYLGPSAAPAQSPQAAAPPAMDTRIDAPSLIANLLKNTAPPAAAPAAPKVPGAAGAAIPPTRAFDPSAPLGGKAGAAIAKSHAQQELIAQQQAQSKSVADWNAAKTDYTKAEAAGKRRDTAFKKDLEPLEKVKRQMQISLDQSKLLTDAARRKEVVAQTAHIIAQSGKLQLETKKLKTEMELDAHERGLMNGMMGPNAAAFYGKNKADIYKFREGRLNEFQKIDTQARSATTAQEGILAKGDAMAKRLDNIQSALKNPKTPPEDVPNLRAEAQKLKTDLDTNGDDLKVANAHLLELQPLREDARQAFINLNEAMKKTGAINTMPPHTEMPKPSKHHYSSAYQVAPVTFKDGVATTPAQAAKMTPAQLRAHNGVTATKEVRGPGAKIGAKKSGAKKDARHMSKEELFRAMIGK